MIDSIQPKYQPHVPQHQYQVPHEQKPPRKRWFRFKFTFIILVLLALGIFVGSKIAIYAQRIFDTSGGVLSLLQKAGQLFISSDKKLQGEAETGQIRILLMGIGGEGHDGPNLTDTMILATIDVSTDTPKVSMVSIPRDFFINVAGFGYQKINAAYAYGQQGGAQNGGNLALSTVQNLAGENIPYYATVDFQGFEKVIDDLGGVDINVDRTFTDYTYPDAKEGYLPPITFEAGPQHMDGVRALEYVRSRHGNNGEGTDFARSKRQEKVLQAMKDKGVKLNVITNLTTINQILDDLSQHIHTNLEPFELKRIYDLVKDIDPANLHASSIDGESGLVCDHIDEVTQAYTLIPCKGFTDYSDIQNFIKNQFAESPIPAEKASLEIQNSTTIYQLGRRVQNLVATPNLQITTGNYREDTVYTQSIIYDNTKGQKQKTLNYLKEKLGALVASGPFPFPTSSTQPDFVIIVARDMDAKAPADAPAPSP